MPNLILKTIPHLLGLFFLSIYVSKATFSIFSSLLCLALIFFSVIKKQLIWDFIKLEKLFFSLIASYLLLFTVINFFHFSFNQDFFFSLKQTRGLCFVLLIIPYIYSDRKRLISMIHNQNYQYILWGVFFLSTLIILDSFLKLHFSKPTIANLLRNSPGDSYLMRASWTYNPIPFSRIMFFLSSLIGTYSVFMFNINKLKAKVALSFSTLAFAVTLMAQSRATWLSIIIITPLIFFLTPHHKKKILMAFTGVLSILLVLPGGISLERLKSYSAFNSFSNKYRIEQFKANIAISLDHPLIGIGYAKNRKKEVIDRYMGDFKNHKNFFYSHPHNEYVDKLAGVGFPLLFIYLLILLYPVLAAFKLLLAKKEDSAETYLIISSLATVLVCYVSSFFDVIAAMDWALISLSWAFIFSVKHNRLNIYKNSSNL